MLLLHLAQIPGLPTGGGSSQCRYDQPGRQDSIPAKAGPSALNGSSVPLRSTLEWRPLTRTGLSLLEGVAWGDCRERKFL